MSANESSLALKKYVFFALAGIVAAGGGAMAVYNSVLGIAFIGLLAWVVVTLVTPPKGLVFLWAFLLPIWSVGSINPVLFDIARLVLAVSIVIRCKGHQNSRITFIAAAIAGVGVPIVLIGLARDDSRGFVLGYTMLLAAVTAWMVMSRVTQTRIIYGGYLAGVCASASVLVLSAAGWNILVPLDDPGLDRLTGLAPSATLVTYQLAVGVLISLCLFERRRFLTYGLSACVCLVALLLSGGRGGVIALAMALLLALRWRRVRLLPALALGGLGYLAFSVLQENGLTFNTLMRFETPSQNGATDLTTGRETLLQASILEVLNSPFIGMGLDQFEGVYTKTPHTALLTFYVAGGILPGLLIIILFFAIMNKMLFLRPASGGAINILHHLVLAVMTVEVLLEPLGPFVGTENLTMLLLGLGAAVSEDEREKRSELRHIESPRTFSQNATRSRADF